METLIGLLIVVLPLVFKLIGKRMEQAAQAQQPVAQDDEPIEDWTETLRRYVEQHQAQSAMFEQDGPVEEPLDSKPVVEAPRVVPVKKKTPILVEEEAKEKEKIDVKKMIVYSEIMKPKYTE